MAGPMGHLAIVAAALNAQWCGREWHHLHGYATRPQVAGAILENRFDLSDLSAYYVKL